ncbi:MAG: hypothetical protein NCW75_04095 [Phycisphaera sp.]|nr:MAG: hypothetical protein NCW75_04095 [Phycisphaera sp.]
MTNETNPPIDHVRLGAIRAAIWRNTDSQGRSRYNVTFERGYVNQKGDWQSSTSYGRDDLLTLAKVADLANTRIHEIQTEDREHADHSGEGTEQQDVARAAATQRTASR